MRILGVCFSEVENPYKEHLVEKHLLGCLPWCEKPLWEAWGEVNLGCIFLRWKALGRFLSGIIPYKRTSEENCLCGGFLWGELSLKTFWTDASFVCVSLKRKVSTKDIVRKSIFCINVSGAHHENKCLLGIILWGEKSLLKIFQGGVSGYVSLKSNK